MNGLCVNLSEREMDLVGETRSISYLRGGAPYLEYRSGQHSLHQRKCLGPDGRSKRIGNVIGADAVGCEEGHEGACVQNQP